MPPRIDTSNYPLVVVVAQGEPTHEGVAAYLAEMSALLERDEKHAVVLDARAISRLGSDMRQQVNRWTEQNRSLLAKTRICYALVSGSVWTRSLVSAVYWIKEPPFAHRTFSELQPALQWARKQLETDS